MADISQIQVGSTTYNICDAQSRTNVSNLQSTVSGHTTSINSLNTTVGGHTTSIDNLNTTKLNKNTNCVCGIKKVYSRASGLTGNVPVNAWYVSHVSNLVFDFSNDYTVTYNNGEGTDRATDQLDNYFTSSISSIWFMLYSSFGAHVTFTNGLTCQSGCFWNKTNFESADVGSVSGREIGNHTAVPLPGAASNVFVHLGSTAFHGVTPTDYPTMYVQAAFHQYPWSGSSTVTRDEVSIEGFLFFWGHH